MKPTSLITGTGAYLPPNKVHVSELSEFIEGITEKHVSPERLGTTQRRFEVWEPEKWRQPEWRLAEPVRGEDGLWHIPGDEAYKSDTEMAIAASQEALASQGDIGAQVDAVYHATTTPSKGQPDGAAMILRALNLQGYAVDVPGGCAEWLNSLIMAHTAILAGEKGGKLVAGSNITSSYFRNHLDMFKEKTGRAFWPKSSPDHMDPVIFGDGAGAVLLEPHKSEDGRGIVSWYRETNPTHPVEYFEGGGSSHPARQATIDREMHMFRLDFRAINRHAVPTLVRAIEHVAAEGGVALEDIDYFFLHQPSQGLVTKTIKRLDVPTEKVPSLIPEHANVVNANIPLLLNEYQDRLKPKDNVILASVGAGFDAAAVYMKW